MPPELKTTLETVYYASPRNEQLIELFSTLPNYPKLKNHIAFGGVKRGLVHKEDAENVILDLQMHLPDDWERVSDWSIGVRFPKATNRELKYEGSSFLKYKLVDIQSLPDKYIVICPDTTTDRSLPLRMFYPDEWQCVLNYLEYLNITGVVINVGSHPVPSHRQILDLSNQTTLLESIEVLKGAMGYIGIDSFLSVLAAKLFSVPLLYIKGNGKHLEKWKHIYYAPKTRFPFIMKKLFDG